MGYNKYKPNPYAVYLNFINVSSFLSCAFSDEEQKLKSENLALKEKVESLTKELNDLKFGAKNLLDEAKSKISLKDFITAKKILTKLVTDYPTSTETNTAKTQLKLITSKAEEQLFVGGERNKDIEALENYITQYPKGRYFSKANSIIKKLKKSQIKNTYISNPIEESSSYEKPKLNKSKKAYSSSGGMRVGAICCDGTQSSATGRGACSHHDGVCEWLYQ